MATTPTNKQIPSEDPRDLKFNAGKIDEEVNGSADYYTDRFGVQRLTNTGRNNQFQDAQTQREYDFQQFLLSSGYEFLGDYENGPFQFSARNQYIRYDNQYYRLNAATDVGFTTTGIDATSFSSDVTHFVLMDGDTLRQQLASTEEGMGASLVGLSPAGTVQEAIQYVTPEMFSGDVDISSGVNSAVAAFTAAAATKMKVKATPGSKYLIDSPVILPWLQGNAFQTIDLTDAEIITTGNYCPFNQRLSDGTVQVTIVRRNLFGGKLTGPFGRDTIYDTCSLARGIQWQDGLVAITEVSGFCNNYNAFGNTVALQIKSGEARNAMYACYGTSDTLNGLRGTVCAGDSIIQKGFDSLLGNIFVEEAGVQGANPDTTSNDIWNGAAISFGADSVTAGQSTIYNYRCLKFGSAALSMTGTGNRLLGFTDFGSVGDNLINKGDAVWIGGTNNYVENINIDSYYNGLSLGTSTGTRLGKIRLGQRTTAGQYSLTTGTNVTDCIIEKFHLDSGQNAKLNEIFIQASDITIRELVWRNAISLLTTLGDYPIRLVSSAKIGHLQIIPNSTLTSVVDWVRVQANARIGKFEIVGAFYGTALLVDAGAVPIIDRIILAQSGTSGRRPILLNASSGTQTFFWGDVTITGNTYPGLNGVLRMNSFNSNSLSWYFINSAMAAYVRYPTPVDIQVN